MLSCQNKTTGFKESEITCETATSILTPGISASGAGDVICVQCDVFFLCLAKPP